MIRKCLFAVTLLVLASCQKPDTADSDVVSKTWAGGVAKAAQAPDGTILWVTRWNGDYVFFAASGTRWQTHRAESTTDGKGHQTLRTVVEDHDVPTAGVVDVARAWSEK